MASHELTLKNYQKQLKDNIKFIYDNYMDILRTKTEHVNFEVQVKSAEIVRSYQSLMQLVSDIRTFLIINDLVGINDNQQQTGGIGGQQQGTSSQTSAPVGGPPLQPSGSQTTTATTATVDTDEKLVKLRDEISMFLYELEIPLVI